jgi:hypothetical protein
MLNFRKEANIFDIYYGKARYGASYRCDF